MGCLGSAMNRPVTTASNLRRRQLCPGSQRMEFGLPEDESEESKEGVLLHDYDAHPEYDRSLLSPERRDLLERNFNLKQQIAQRLDAVIGSPVVSPLREPHLHNDLISGTPDLVTFFRNEDYTTWVNDSKFGYSVVERAELNLQLRVYAVLVHDFQEQKPRQIFVSITQPRLPYDERITLAEYGEDDIHASRVEIKDILDAAAKEDAPLIAGEEQCRYCKAKMICPEFQRTMTVPTLAIRPEQALSKTAREAYLEQKLSECTDAQIEQLLLARSLAGMISNPLLDEARKRIANGGLRNHFLTKPKQERVITDAQRAVALLALGKVATRDEILGLARFPLGELEEKYRERAKCTWKEAREKIDKVLQSVIEIREEKPHVKRK